MTDEGSQRPATLQVHRRDRPGFLLHPRSELDCAIQVCVPLWFSQVLAGPPTAFVSGSLEPCLFSRLPALICMISSMHAYRRCGSEPLESHGRCEPSSILAAGEKQHPFPALQHTWPIDRSPSPSPSPFPPPPPPRPKTLYAAPRYRMYLPPLWPSSPGKSFISESFCQRLQVYPEDILGRPLSSIVDLRDTYALARAVQFVLNGGYIGARARGDATVVSERWGNEDWRWLCATTVGCQPRWNFGEFPVVPIAKWLCCGNPSFCQRCTQGGILSLVVRQPSCEF